MKTVERHWDVVIAGGGLAGACTALALSGRRSVLLLEAKEPAAGASGAAAGLANPIMGRRPRRVWRVDEALEALNSMMAQAGVEASRRGVLRPAQSEAQARAYRESAQEHPEHAAWWPQGRVRETHPEVVAPHGAFFARTGLALDIPAFVYGCLRQAEANGARVESGVRVVDWAEANGTVRLEMQGRGGREVVYAEQVVLTVGQGYVRFPRLAALPLKRIKGQTLRVRVDAAEEVDKLPCLGGSGYVVPGEEGRLVLGSSYEHQFEDLEPSAAQTEHILDKTKQILPLLEDARLEEVRAGARVKVTSSRYPLVDRLPGCEHIWTFIALGSKGLLMAPLLARRLAQALTGTAGLPEEVHLRERP